MKKYIVVLGVFLPLVVFSQKTWTLEESIDYAIKNNLQVIANANILKREEKNLQMAKNDFLPTVSGNMNNSLRFGHTQGFQGDIGKNDNFNNDLNVSANFLIYNGGRIEKQKQKITYDLEVAEYNLALIKNNIALQIIQQYLSILLNKEILKVNKSAVENAQRLYDQAKITTEVGTTAKTVLAEAESTLAKERQSLKLAEIDIKRSLFSLAQTLQLKDYHHFDIEDIDISREFDIYPYSLESIYEKTLKNHPQIKSAESSIKSAEAQSKVIKTAFMPTISLSAGIGTFYYNSLVTDITGIDTMGNYIKESTLPQQFKNNFYQQVGVSINVPIFNKGNSKIQVEQAKINEDIAKNNLAIQKQELLQNIQKVYFDMESYYQTFVSATETEKSTGLALDFAEKSYIAGKTNIYDLNIARNNHTTAKSAVIQAKYNYVYQTKLLEFYKKGVNENRD